MLSLCFQAADIAPEMVDFGFHFLPVPVRFVAGLVYKLPCFFLKGCAKAFKVGRRLALAGGKRLIQFPHLTVFQVQFFPQAREILFHFLEILRNNFEKVLNFLLTVAAQGFLEGLLPEWYRDQVS